MTCVYLCGGFCLGVFVRYWVCIIVGVSMAAWSGSQSEAGVYHCL